MDLQALLQANASHFTPVNLPPPSSSPYAQSTVAIAEAADSHFSANGVTQKANGLENGDCAAGTLEVGQLHGGTSNDADMDGEEEDMGHVMTAPKRGRGRPRKDASAKPVVSLAAQSKASQVKQGERRVLGSESSDSIPATHATAHKRGRGRPPKEQHNGRKMETAVKKNVKVSKDKVTKNAPVKAKYAINGDRRGEHMKDMQNFFSAHRHEVEEHKFKRQQKLLGKMVSKPENSYPHKYLARSYDLCKHSIRTFKQERRQAKEFNTAEKMNPEHLLEKAKSTADRCAQWKESVEKEQNIEA